MKTKIEQLSDTEEKRAGLVLALRQLQQSEGWMFIQEVLKYNVSELQKDINDTNSKYNEKRDWRVKVKREYQEQMIDMPEKFAKDLTKTTKKKTDLDPYE